MVCPLQAGGVGISLKWIGYSNPEDLFKSPPLFQFKLSYQLYHSRRFGTESEGMVFRLGLSFKHLFC